VVLQGTGGGEVEWGERMGMVTQGGNVAAGIGLRRGDERIGLVGERCVQE
jgi:hypothetical protein